MAASLYTVARYIPHALADAYAEQGWCVTPLDFHHGRYSMLATLDVEEVCEDQPGVFSGAGAYINPDSTI